jgi:hypothetical protein
MAVVPVFSIIRSNGARSPPAIRLSGPFVNFRTGLPGVRVNVADTGDRGNEDPGVCKMLSPRPELVSTIVDGTAALGFDRSVSRTVTSKQKVALRQLPVVG